MVSYWKLDSAANPAIAIFSNPQGPPLPHGNRHIHFRELISDFLPGVAWHWDKVHSQYDARQSVRVLRSSNPL